MKQEKSSQAPSTPRQSTPQVQKQASSVILKKGLATGVDSLSPPEQKVFFKAYQDKFGYGALKKLVQKGSEENQGELLKKDAVMKKCSGEACINLSKTYSGQTQDQIKEKVEAEKTNLKKAAKKYNSDLKLSFKWTDTYKLHILGEYGVFNVDVVKGDLIISASDVSISVKILHEQAMEHKPKMEGFMKESLDKICA